MLIVRFKMRCRPERTAEMVALMTAVAHAGRQLPGVIHFDIARELIDENAIVCTEIYEDREAMDREEALPEVPPVLQLIDAGALVEPPEWTIYEVASFESPPM